MTTIFFYLFIFISFLFLAKEKFRLQEKALTSKSKLIYKIAKCDYCFEFWISVFTVLFVNVILGNWNRADLVMPFAIMGVWLLILKITKWVE